MLLCFVLVLVLVHLHVLINNLLVLVLVLAVIFSLLPLLSGRNPVRFPRARPSDRPLWRAAARRRVGFFQNE